MKNIDWQKVAASVRELHPHVLQIATYSRNRWILVFEAEPENFLNSFHPLIKMLKKHRLPVPLIASKQFIQKSLDSYPLEFLDIQSDYKNLYVVEDLLAELTFEKKYIRLQIERELKSKWLLTRLTALQHNQKSKPLFALLKDSFQAMLPVFKGFCYLSGMAVPAQTRQLLENLEEILHTENKALHFISSQTKAPSILLLTTMFNDYIRFLNICSDKIDGWTI